MRGVGRGIRMGTARHPSKGRTALARGAFVEVSFVCQPTRRLGHH